MRKRYQFGFSAGGLVLFLVIMLPNFIWFAHPAPNDLLRGESVTGTLDAIASVCQVLLVTSLCMVVRRVQKELRLTPLLAVCMLCCLLYGACWLAYYQGLTNPVVMLGLTIPPCLAFLFYALDRQNGIAVVPIAGFTVCHLLHTIANYLC